VVSHVRVGSRRIGPGEPCLVIAEAGVNHDGDPGRARLLVEAAADCGADAVKFQSFDAEQLVTPDAPKAEYQLRSDATETQLEMLKRLELGPEAHRELAAACRDRGLLFLSTPFDEPSADLLEELDVPAFKIGSGELTNLPFLAHVAGKGRPMILSTGMANMAEVGEAVSVVRRAGCEELVLLHCVSCYPADPADVNLRAMVTLERQFGVPVGYSDHTLGVEVALAAVALGATVLEKHLTLDRHAPGPDHAASLQPTELRRLVEGVRRIETALGDGRKVPADAEADTARVARRSLVAARPISAGTPLAAEMIAIRRPGTGLAPAMRDVVLGRRTRIDIEAGQVITGAMLQ
jgi:N-acetylneuraminate synthase